ncbi:Uncharacterised protein [Niallia circulans]|uniref:hypothetical protein n=1 Tax=Niallia circulans TaxID=1397 RepID=UPI00077C8EEB|nr:hypothetical protein [Niallia circulans]MDR4318419.1 hypothetical protein [Niallia circulans]MED3839258.1 hypothetical protein [Niallia circulans]MED4242397.1 hypothetical protein [Niallia circulans]MED4250499.1 hypothetical protein [Niallia circulans]QKH59813.1 hypothetical protein FOC77_03625 [Niallia circulans]
MEKVELPLDVYNAFEGVKNSWGKLVNKDEINLLLLQIIHLASETVGDSVVLKKFALEHPTKYVCAIANGYKLDGETKLVKQVDQLINTWLDTEYKGDEKQDRFNFAQELTQFIKGRILLQK